MHPGSVSIDGPFRTELLWGAYSPVVFSHINLIQSANVRQARGNQSLRPRTAIYSLVKLGYHLDKCIFHLAMFPPLPSFDGVRT
jgi:hypothetical protein